jgi:hypothetical protein
MPLLLLYIVFRVSGVAALLSFGAVIVLTDVWEAAFAALAIAAGMAFILSAIALLAAGEQASTPTRA